MKRKLTKQIRQYVCDRQKRKIQELYKRQAEAENECDAYRYESDLINQIIAESSSPTEIDRWEFEGQITAMNIQQLEFDLERINEELEKEMRLYERGVGENHSLSQSHLPQNAPITPQTLSHPTRSGDRG